MSCRTVPSHPADLRDSFDPARPLPSGTAPVSGPLQSFAALALLVGSTSGAEVLPQVGAVGAVVDPSRVTVTSPIPLLIPIQTDPVPSDLTRSHIRTNPIRSNTIPNPNQAGPAQSDPIQPPTNLPANQLTGQPIHRTSFPTSHEPNRSRPSPSLIHRTACSPTNPVLPH